MRISKLDGLRGIFSLMVVIYHYPAEYIPEFIHTSFIVAKSYLFVDFFFVLSGFVIAYNYSDRLKSTGKLGTFIQKRIIRLYPLLVFTTLVFLSVTLGAKVLLPELTNNSGSFLPAILETVNTLTFLNSTPVLSGYLITNPLGMNYPSWSISAEMFAYIFFGAISLWCMSQKRNVVLASSIVLGMLFLLTKSAMRMEGNYDFLRGILSFNIGYFVFLFSKKNLKINNGLEVGLVVALVGLFYFATTFSDGLSKTLLESCLIPLFFGLSIFTLVHTNGIVSKLMSAPPFQFLGKISYSVYLNHAIFLFVLPKAFFSVLKFQQSTAVEIAVLIVIVIMVIIYSVITYNIVERNCGNLLKRLILEPLPVASPKMVVSMVPQPNKEPVQNRRRGESL